MVLAVYKSVELLSTPSINAVCVNLNIIIIYFVIQVAKCHIKVELVNDNYTELSGEIVGPPDTAYDGGKFLLEIKIPDTYPFNPPKV